MLNEWRMCCKIFPITALPFMNILMNETLNRMMFLWTVDGEALILQRTVNLRTQSVVKTAYSGSNLFLLQIPPWGSWSYQYYRPSTTQMLIMLVGMLVSTQYTLSKVSSNQ